MEGMTTTATTDRLDLANERGGAAPGVTVRGAAPSDDASTGELLREAVAEAKQLALLEIALAKQEVVDELAQAKRTAIAMSAAAVLALEGLSLLLVALALAAGGGPAPALILGVVLLVVAGSAAYFGWRTLPRKPLHRTQRRLRTDAQVLKETVA